jgi:hypothetical protein
VLLLCMTVIQRQSKQMERQPLSLMGPVHTEASKKDPPVFVGIWTQTHCGNDHAAVASQRVLRIARLGSTRFSMMFAVESIDILIDSMVFVKVNDFKDGSLGASLWRKGMCGDDEAADDQHCHQRQRSPHCQPSELVAEMAVIHHPMSSFSVVAQI